MKNLPKLLIVEDDRVIGENLTEYLTKEGFIIHHVVTGGEGISLLEKTKYDLIILDINLPDINGFEVCEKFRKSNSEIPILMLTAYDELEDKVKRSNSKFQTSELIWIEDLSINMSTSSVQRSKKEINLTPREFNLLLMLVRAKGKIVTKRELNKEIWGGSLDEHNNTIEVYINFLRKKIDKPFTKALIKTKIGFGYYLDIL